MGLLKVTDDEVDSAVLVNYAMHATVAAAEIFLS